MTKKKLIVFGVAAVLAISSCFAFSGCSGDDAEKSASSSSQKVSEEKAEVKNDKTTQEAEVKEEAAPGADSSAKEGSEAEQNDGQISAPAGESEAPVSAPVNQTPPEDTKYGDAEIYENASGNPAAKTEDGVEVEITSENMGKLIDEYQKVQGSGSDEEKAILDQIQLILEASQQQQ